MRNQKGITLVALILVFLVLLILAGVSISLVVSDNNSSKETNQVQSSNVQTVVENEAEEVPTVENEVVENTVDDTVYTPAQ